MMWVTVWERTVTQRYNYTDELTEAEALHSAQRPDIADDEWETVAVSPPSLYKLTREGV